MKLEDKSKVLVPECRQSVGPQLTDVHSVDAHFAFVVSVERTDDL